MLIEAASDDSEIQLKSSGDAATKVWTIYKDSATDDLRLNQNGDKVTIDNSTGNVGLGTTTPTAAKLQVQTGSGDGIYAKSDSGTTAIFAVAGSAVGDEDEAAIVASSQEQCGIRAYSSSRAAMIASSEANVALSVSSGGSTAPAINVYHSRGGPAINASVNSGAGYPCIQAERFDGGTGLKGATSTGAGVVGVTHGEGFGVKGISYDPDGWCGGFVTNEGNGVTITTPAGKAGLSVVGGTKSAVVQTAGGARSLYCEEASEVWFSDYGFGKLESGVALVPIDPVFAQVVDLTGPYHVFVQAYDDADIYVSSRRSTGFEVRLRDGNPSAEFSYRLVAKRLGYEKERLAPAPWADEGGELLQGRAVPRQGED
jgi:hypothetical protein